MVASKEKPSRTVSDELKDITKEIKYETVVTYLPDDQRMDIKPLKTTHFVINTIRIPLFVSPRVNGSIASAFMIPF